MSKVNLVYFSPSGTTKKVALLLSEKMGREAKIYDLFRGPLADTVFCEDTPTIVATPVFEGRVPALFLSRLEKLRGAKSPAIAVAVYGNRAYDDAVLELKDTLNENGFVVIAAAAFVARHSVFTQVASARPDERDKEKIASFARTCNLKLENYTGTENISVKGQKPYRKMPGIPFCPTGNSRCNACGTCVRVCPVKAISAEDPRKTDKNLCIRCAACITLCPQRARGFHVFGVSLIGMGFAAAYGRRKEPEFFI